MSCNEAFRLMNDVCGVMPHRRRPFLFISCHLSRGTRRRLRAMSRAARWSCLVDMAARTPGGGKYVRSVRSASCMVEYRDRWEKYIITGKGER